MPIKKSARENEQKKSQNSPEKEWHVVKENKHEEFVNMSIDEFNSLALIGNKNHDLSCFLNLS